MSDTTATTSATDGINVQALTTRLYLVGLVEVPVHELPTVHQYHQAMLRSEHTLQVTTGPPPRVCHPTRAN
jgi:hypothetical protein